MLNRFIFSSIVVVALTSFSWIGAEFVISKDPKDIIDLRKVLPQSSVIFDIKFATNDNFIHEKVYKSDRCFAHKDVAIALEKVVAQLEKENLGLLIYDVLRPQSAQEKFWEICPDPRYVSDPKKGGRHTRGTAVDCTLIDLKTKQPLDMGGNLSDMSEKAWHSCDTISAEAKHNRQKLVAVMTAHGFEIFETEWWHYDFKGWRNYPVLDVNLEELD